MKVTVYYGNESTMYEEAGVCTATELLRRHGFPIDSPCGGRGSCGKCKIKAFGRLSPPSQAEKKLLSEKELEEGVRLACRCFLLGDCTLMLQPAEIRAGAEAPAEPAAPLGLALDIGTTTIAGAFYELSTKQKLSEFTVLNRQRAFGHDVISRIQFTMEAPQNRAVLQKILVKQINEQIGSRLVEQCVLCGNTAMMHFLFGLDASSLASYPHTPRCFFGESFSGRDIGLNAGAGYAFPCISGFVGGDTAAGLLALELAGTKKPYLLIDIGTNGEIALHTGKEILCCSCAAGPAFEGAHISGGCGAVEGAVWGVRRENGRMSFSTIGDAPACGVCGSGLIDWIACLLEEGLLEENGYLEKPVRLGDSAVYLEPQDVREIQLAKAAMAAGVDTLLQKAALTPEEIATAALAGSFGEHLNPASACRIGLIPKGLEEKLVSAGNTALYGAKRVLLQGYNQEMALLLETIRYIELESDPVFNEAFVERLTFPS